jgi:hypothetical protein
MGRREVALEVHHRYRIANWDAVIDAVYREILCDPAQLEPLCRACHAKEHEEE